MKLHVRFFSGALLFASAVVSSAQDLPVMDGLQLWLDATDSSTVFQEPFFQNPASDGDFVESWMDKSSNQYEAFVDFENSAGAPIYQVDGMNGLPSVRFFGEFADGMLIDELELERPYTAFIANQYWGDTGGRTLQSQDINWLLGLWGGNYGHYAEGWVNSPQPAAEVNRPYVADAVGTESESFFVVNGTDWTVNSSPVGVPGALAIGGAGQFPGEVSDADVSEIIIYDRVLSADELTSMRTHLYEKYNAQPVDGPPPPPELIVHEGAVGTFTGAADLDFAGDFVYAVNVGGPGDDFFGDPLTIGDAVFVDGTNAAEPDLNADGVTMTVANEILNWNDPDYGDTEADDNLELVIQSIRWNVPPGVAIDMEVEEGASYKLQMMFAEACCDRGFDIFMDDDEVVTDLVVQEQQGGIANQEMGVSYSREFVAGDDELNILLGGSVGVPDNNPILSGLTLERIEDIPTEGDCNGDGVVDINDANCTADDQLDDFLASLTPPTLRGDADGDGQVQFTDLVTLSNNFGLPGMYTDADFDKDGVVQFGDLVILSDNFGMSGAAVAAVPEPSSLALTGWLAVAAVACLRRRRRQH